MHRILSLLLSILPISILYSQNTTYSKYETNLLVDSAIKAITEKASERITAIEKKVDDQSDKIDKSFDGVSAQISASSYSLSAFAIIISILTIGLGLYITWVERKILKLKTENTDLLNQNLKVKKEVEDLNNLIQSDIYGLYEKMKRQETIDLLNRLNKVPKDITHLSPSLLSRNLIPEDFSIIKRAHLSLKGVYQQHNFTELYLLLFFQHFLVEAFQDPDIKEEIVNYIPSGIEFAWENDMEKFAIDFAKVLLIGGINNNKKAINNVFGGLRYSPYKDYLPFYKTLFSELRTRVNQFTLFSASDSNDQTIDAKVNFGELLVNGYGQLNQTESERLILEEVKNLREELQKREEELLKIQQTQG